MPSASLQFINLQAEVVNTVDMPLSSTSWDLLYHRLRANFDHCRSPYCDVPPFDPSHGEAVYDHGSTVTDVRYIEDQAVIEYVDCHGDEYRATVDMIIGADGASSMVRSVLEPTLERKYVGYVAWRGKVPEAEVSAGAREVFGKNITFFQMPGSHILL